MDHIIVRFKVLAKKGVCLDWCMSAEWAARDKQPILLTSNNPYITIAAGTQWVK